MIYINTLLSAEPSQLVASLKVSYNYLWIILHSPYSMEIIEYLLLSVSVKFLLLSEIILPLHLLFCVQTILLYKLLT